MAEIFTKKAMWFAFANAHNEKVNSNATLLNGSKSYTLVAIHLAAGKEIPSDVRLADETIRKKGVAGHFSGLRQFHESKILRQDDNWTPLIVEECRKFAKENSLNSDELIQKVIELTEKGGKGIGVVSDKAVLKTSKNSFDNTYLPTKEDFESAYRMVSRPGESISIDAVLDQLEINAGEKGYTLKSNWRMITEENMKIWSKNG